VTESTRGAAEPTAAELEAEIAEARSNLASTIEQLRAETTPQALARRGADKVKGFFTDEYGGVRPDRVAIVVGAVATLMVLRGVRRRRRRARLSHR
jgi:hypothetical protein